MLQTHEATNQACVTRLRPVMAREAGSYQIRPVSDCWPKPKVTSRRAELSCRSGGADVKSRLLSCLAAGNCIYRDFFSPVSGREPFESR